MKIKRLVFLIAVISSILYLSPNAYASMEIDALSVDSIYIDADFGGVLGPVLNAIFVPIGESYDPPLYFPMGEYSNFSEYL
jgi:hypothetical protein